MLFFILIALASAQIQFDASNYSFVVISDSHLNSEWFFDRRISYSVVINRTLEIDPLFVVVNGDIVGRSTRQSFDVFVEASRPLRDRGIPLILVNGNHDIGSDPLSMNNNYLNAQFALTGRKELYYAFDAGRWHYIILPTIKTLSNSTNYDLMIRWLKRQISINRGRPTILFVHYHYVPQGLTQLEFYTEDLAVRNQILKIVLRYGNVKYWFAGHVHIGIEASIKNALSYKGCNFITLPTIVNPRPYGEEYNRFRDGLFHGGYFLEVEINQDNATINGLQISTMARRQYPKIFRSFKQKRDPRWFNRVSEMEGNDELINGDFSKKNSGWKYLIRYQNHGERIFVNQITSGLLKLSVGYNSSIDSGSWRSDEMTEVYQMINRSNRSQLSLEYFIEERSNISGGYIRIHLFNQTSHAMTFIFYFGHNCTDLKDKSAVGSNFANIAAGVSNVEFLTKSKTMAFFEIDAEPESWHSVKIDLDQILEQIDSELEYTKYMLALGAWAYVKSTERVTVLYANVSLDEANGESSFVVDSGIFLPRFTG